MGSASKFAIYPSLIDRVVIISGGAMGIGASMVEHFALQGSQVIFLDIQMDAAKGLVEKIAQLGARHAPVFHQCDMTDIDGAVRPTAAMILEAHPVVHAVINNAAATAKAVRQPTMDVTAETWDAGAHVNLRHQFFLTQALMPGLQAAGGQASVVNMGSITWAIPSTGVVGYATCKAAVVGLTKTLAHEFGPRGVRVNSIMPGSIATETEKRDVHTPEYKEMVLARQALKRLLQPEDVARTALWLVADDSEGITSQSIVVDGGWI